jgi:hypothetical protein
MCLSFRFIHSTSYLVLVILCIYTKKQNWLQGWSVLIFVSYFSGRATWPVFRRLCIVSLVAWTAMFNKSSSSSIDTTTLSWVLACSTVVEHSQQEGFTECRCQRHVKPPTWRRTRDLERSNFRHKRPSASEATLANPAAEGRTMGEKWRRKFAESGDFHVTFGFFYMP